MWRSALILVLLVLLGATAQAAPSMRVGSKQFTEGVILGEIVAEVALDAGAKVDHEAQMGGTRILWTALQQGEIDVYVEYTGTLSEEILQARPASLAELRAMLEARGIGLIGPLGFENTYALGMREDRAAALGIRTISDLAAHPDLVVGLSNEFLERKDGWPGLSARYGLAGDVRGLVHDLAYKALSERQIDVTDVYTTDAEIERLGVRVLEDDRHYFPDYDAVILYNLAWGDRAPDVVAALQRLVAAIPPADMIAMNAQVSIDHRSEVDVAGDFVRDHLGMTARRAGAGRADRIWQRTKEHAGLVALALLIAVVVALPLGIAAANRPVLGQVVLGVVGILQTVPSLALLVLLIRYLGIGGPPAIAAMATYSLLPIVRNTHAGLTGISTPVRESAEVLGLSRWARLVRVELPLASPSILAGIQTAAVLCVGTATIGALIGAGGYGQPILTGIRLDDQSLILEGALPAAAMALLVQGLFEGVSRLVVPRALRRAPVLP
jgi:osmoprotectant transport system permease protein